MIALDQPLDPATLRARTGRTYRPWSAEHMVLLWMADMVALALLMICWWEVASTGILRTQLTWIELGMAGLVIAGAANALWLLRGRQSVALASAMLLQESVLADLDVVGQGTGDGTAAGATVHVPGGSRFHRPGCAFVADRVARPMPRADLERAGLEPCQICSP